MTRGDIDSILPYMAQDNQHIIDALDKRPLGWAAANAPGKMDAAIYNHGINSWVVVRCRILNKW